MTRHILVRLGLGLGTLFVVSALLFFGADALPGDAATAILGQQATPSSVKDLQDQLGLDRPVVYRYADWLGGFVHGDLGISTASQRPVKEILSPLVVNTLALTVLTVLLLIPLSVLFGALAAIQGRSVDNATTTSTLALISMPEFVVGNLLIFAFALHWTVFPAASVLDPEQSPFAQPKYLVLPALTLLAVSLAQTIRMVRAALLDVLQSDYVEMARLKGVPERSVVFQHALPNALPPIVQVIILNIAFLLGGVVVVENVFQYPGIGAAMANAVADRDLSILLAIGMLITTIFVVLNLVADVIVTAANPRLRRTQ